MICQTVVAHSRFAQAALLLESAGRYRLAGSAGLDKATAAALDELAARIPAAGFLAAGSAPPAVEQSQTVSLDLTPWLRPGDDLKRLRFTSAAGRAHGGPRNHRGRAVAGRNVAKLAAGDSEPRFPIQAARCEPTTCCRSRC